MKAARYYGPRDIRVEQIDEPVATKGQVKIKIAWNGICGSDLHAFLKTISTLLPLDTSKKSLPITMGHEFSGTIVEVGPDVDPVKWSVGTNVVVEPLVSCMETDTCNSCASGSRNVCPRIDFIGLSEFGGGLAEYIAVDVNVVHILPDSVPLEVGSCVEPLAVAWHAVKRSGFKAGQCALIIGGGPIGLFLLKVLRGFDASATIIVSEPASVRRQLALRHGATQALDPTQVIIPDRALEITGGIGVDVAFDAAGVQNGLDAAIGSLRPRGVLVNVALWEEIAKVDMNLLVLKEITFTGIIAYDRVHTELIEAIAAKKITGIEDLITSKIAIEDVVEKGFLVLLNGRGSEVKILVHP